MNKDYETALKILQKHIDRYAKMQENTDPEDLINWAFVDGARTAVKNALIEIMAVNQP